MTYAVKECFLTLQGEGVQSGSRAVFLRFAGCNLWSGREQDRASAQCSFCDTDFVGTDGEGGGKFAEADALADHVLRLWGDVDGPRLVVITGGEPMLQLDPALVEALHERGFRVAVESNGTLPAVDGVDWLDDAGGQRGWASVVDQLQQGVQVEPAVRGQPPGRLDREAGFEEAAQAPAADVERRTLASAAAPQAKHGVREVVDGHDL